ncbi:helix-turn-helix domain-containing protein [Tateyamaria sp.]|uniref:helix-turn-helix domain-containing protein n=1 Tax=Tateyamaria sp. TaxID=1929288 RepID=UPI00329FFC25
MPASENNLGSKRVPLVRAAILLPVLNAFCASGYDANAVLQLINLDERRVSDPETFVTHDVVYSAYNAIASKAGLDFCAQVGDALEWSDFVPFAEKLSHSTSLGEFFLAFTSAVSKESNAVATSFLVEDEHAYFTARRMFQPSVSPAQVDAFMVAVWIGLLHRVLDFRWDPSMLIVQLADPKALPEGFHGVRPIRRDARGFSIRFPSEWLTRSLPDNALVPEQSVVSESTSFPPNDFLASVKNAIREQVEADRMSVEKAAEACGFTVSALNRRLSKHDTTISGVIADIRFEIAGRALMSTDRPIGDIASDLGYSDATAFTRAFRKWTGKSPTAFRNMYGKLAE